MKDLFYYSIFAVILYFVLTAVFDNFTLEQENFDPSLVPVSSIITLAKVAQKLVNGNGTLTNPGNLQIGSSTSAPGNLTVTGNANINGTLFVGNENIVKIITDRITALSTSLTTNALTVNGNANVTGDLTVKGTNIVDTINSRATALENTLNNRVNTLDSTLQNKATEFANSFKTKAIEVNGTINGTGANHFTGYGTDTWLPFTDGNNYLRKNVIIDQGYLGVTKDVVIGGNLNLSYTSKILLGDDGESIQFHSNDGIKIQTYNGGTLSTDNQHAGGAGTQNTDILAWNQGGVGIKGNLNITGKLQFNGASAMIVKDFTGADLTYNNTYGYCYDTGISGNYQASIGWCTRTVRWEQYAPYLVWTGTWLFVVNNVRDNCCTKSEIKGIRVYAYHNNLFGF